MSRVDLPCVLCLLAACTPKVTEPTRTGKTSDAPGEIRSSVAAPEVGTVSVDGGRPERFLLNRVILRAPRSAQRDLRRIGERLAPKGQALTLEWVTEDAPD